MKLASTGVTLNFIQLYALSSSLVGQIWSVKALMLDDDDRQNSCKPVNPSDSHVFALVAPLGANFTRNQSVKTTESPLVASCSIIILFTRLWRRKNNEECEHAISGRFFLRRRVKDFTGAQKSHPRRPASLASGEMQCAREPAKRKWSDVPCVWAAMLQVQSRAFAVTATKLYQHKSMS